MTIKQAKLIVNAHKHTLLNSFYNNGYVYFKQQENNNNKNQSKIKRQRDRETDRQRHTERQREITLHATLLFHEHSMR